MINSVDNTELPCYTHPPLQHHSLFRNLPPLVLVPGSTAPVTLNIEYLLEPGFLSNLIVLTDLPPAMPSS